jgi:arylsulfatase A-like enzyme
MVDDGPGELAPVTAAIPDLPGHRSAKLATPMTLASLSARDADASAPAQGPGVGILSLLFLSAWCGLLAGLVEVATILGRKRFFDTNQLLGMSRHLVWIVPLTDLLILLCAGLLGCLLAWLRPAAGRRAAARGLCALTLLPMPLVAFPQVYTVAWIPVAIGLSIRIVPILGRHRRECRRVVLATAPMLVAAVAALAGVPWAAGRFERARDRARPVPDGGDNVLLIVMDTVAADHLALYGYGRPTSPAIDELAGRGCRFDAAMSSSSWTLPSHAGMFTGCWPHELSVGWRTPLDAASPTVAEFLRARGYETAGFIANTTYCAADSGLGRGFATYEDVLFRELSALRMAILVQRSLAALETTGQWLGDAFNLRWLKGAVRRVREPFEADRKDAATVNQQFLDWLSHRPQPARPYFAFLNYFDAHSPYQLPASRIHRFGIQPTADRDIRLLRGWWDMDKRRLKPEELAFLLNAYDDCVASIDEQVGRLFDELDRRKALGRTWVILVADHGESFGEHPGVYLHGGSLFQTELHVPLVVIPPPGTSIKPTVAETVSLRDLAATIVDLAGHCAESPFPGASLARLWRPAAAGRGPETSDDRALAELSPNETLISNGSSPPRRSWPVAALVEGGWSYLRRDGDVREQLYDLREDPKERHDVSASTAASARLERMRKTLSNLTGGPLSPDRFNP